MMIIIMKKKLYSLQKDKKLLIKTHLIKQNLQIFFSIKFKNLMNKFVEIKKKNWKEN